MSKITFEDEHGVYAVEVRKEGMTIVAVIDDLIKPVLLAAGYHPENVADTLGPPQ